jgi:hypothetical protein
MAKCLRQDGTTYDDGKDCYAVVSDCRSSTGYKVRAIIGPLVDSWQLPEIDRRAHDVRGVSGPGFDVVDYYSVAPGEPFSRGGVQPVPSLTTLSIWEVSKRHAQGAPPTPEEIEAFATR